LTSIEKKGKRGGGVGWEVGVGERKRVMPGRKTIKVQRAPLRLATQGRREEKEGDNTSGKGSSFRSQMKSAMEPAASLHTTAEKEGARPREKNEGSENSGPWSVYTSIVKGHRAREGLQRFERRQ